MSFKGIALEVQGNWGDDLKQMFRHFITLGATNSGIPFAVLANYWRRRIFMSLQKGVAHAVNTRVNQLISRNLVGSQDAGELEVIEEHADAWIGGVPLEWDVDG